MEVIYCSQVIDSIINKKKICTQKKKTFWQLQRSPHSHKEQCLLGKRRTRKWENHTHLSLKKKIVVCIIHAHMHTLQHRKTQTRCSLWNGKVSFRKFFLLFFYLKIFAIFISFYFDDAFFVTKGSLSARYSDTFRSHSCGITLQTELCIGTITFMCFCAEIRGNTPLALQHFDIKHLTQVRLHCSEAPLICCLGKNKNIKWL